MKRGRGSVAFVIGLVICALLWLAALELNISPEFETTFDDGELSFRCVMQAMDGMPSDQVIGTAIVSAVRAIEMNAEDIHQVAIGASTAHDMIYAGEAKLEQ